MYGLAAPAHPAPYPCPLVLHAPASSCTALSDETSPGGLGWAISSLPGIAGCPPSSGCHPSCQHLLYNHLLCEDIPEFPSSRAFFFLSAVEIVLEKGCDQPRSQMNSDTGLLYQSARAATEYTDWVASTTDIHFLTVLEAASPWSSAGKLDFW